MTWWRIFFLYWTERKIKSRLRLEHSAKRQEREVEWNLSAVKSYFKASRCLQSIFLYVHSRPIILFRFVFLITTLNLMSFTSFFYHRRKLLLSKWDRERESGTDSSTPCATFPRYRKLLNSAYHQRMHSSDVLWRKCLKITSCVRVERNFSFSWHFFVQKKIIFFKIMFFFWCLGHNVVFSELLFNGVSLTSSTRVNFLDWFDGNNKPTKKKLFRSRNFLSYRKCAWVEISERKGYGSQKSHWAAS